MNELETADVTTADVEPVATVCSSVKTHPTAPHLDGAPADDLFTAEEWNQLRAQDTFAAAAIVAIMISIFALGLIGYIVIAWVCTGG